LSINREIGAIHPAEITPTAFFWRDDVGRMVSLGVEGRGKSEHFGGTELDAKATGFAALNHDGNATFGHEDPHRGVKGTPNQENYGVGTSQKGVTRVTGAGDACTSP
jgi:hypothetical protein